MGRGVEKLFQRFFRYFQKGKGIERVSILEKKKGEQGGQHSLKDKPTRGQSKRYTCLIDYQSKHVPGNKIRKADIFAVHFTIIFADNCLYAHEAFQKEQHKNMKGILPVAEKEDFCYNNQNRK